MVKRGKVYELPLNPPHSSLREKEGEEMVEEQASMLAGERKTQREIVQVTEVTVRNGYNELVERLLFAFKVLEVA